MAVHYEGSCKACISQEATRLREVEKLQVQQLISLLWLVKLIKSDKLQCVSAKESAKHENKSLPQAQFI